MSPADHRDRPRTAPPAWSGGKLDTVPVPSSSLRSRIRAIAAGYPELLAVLAAAIIGLTVQPPLAWLAAHQGINVLLAILVFATAVTIDPAALRRLVTAWRSLVLAVVVGITVLPALSWAVSRIVAAGPLRDGVLVVGLAPCEIASVATTAMAAGEAAVSAGVLIGSTVAAVALAGPILTLEAGHADVSPGSIIANLALVVALPLAVGLAARACAEPPAWSRAQPPAQASPEARAFSRVQPPARASARSNLLAATHVLATPRAERVASRTALAAVAALVALIASEIRLSAAYLAVAAALLLFLIGSALVGHFLGARAARPTATALLLTTSMRDFAIAAGLAAAAFGPAAAAPLGLYGIAVLIWGTAVAGLLRNRTAESQKSTPI
jgi:predicted Na+-dependent transporter